MNKLIAITIGDINGIGIEILIKTWKQKKIKMNPKENHHALAWKQLLLSNEIKPEMNHYIRILFISRSPQ